MNQPQENVREQQVKEFIKNLSQLDDGERARLKRNAGAALSEARQIGLLFYQKILPYGAAAYQEESYFLVATLYPFDKKQRDKDRSFSALSSDKSAAQERQEAVKEARAMTLGASFRLACSEQNATGFDRRVARLLDADRQQLPFQLRQAILRLTADWTPIDWAQLTKDVLNWEHSSRYVQRNWARDYVASKPETN